MFLIRAAFWLTIVILLIPADSQNETPAPRVAFVDAIAAAQATVADLSNFCVRNPDICEASNAAFHVFSEKAQSGARILYRYFDESFQESSTEDEQGTLNERDLLPGWLGPREDGAA